MRGRVLVAVATALAVAVVAAGAAAVTTYGPLWATTGFGGGGSQVLQVGVDVGDPTAIVVAPDHSIIVAVSDETETGLPGIVRVFRLTATGASIGFRSSKRPRLINTDGYCRAALAVHTDGTIAVACGDFIGQIEPDGRVVTIVQSDIPGVYSTLALAPRGRIVTGGSASPDFPGFLVRYLPDGRHDPTFGSKGVVTLSAQPSGITLDHAGGIVAVVGGQVLRYRSDGTLDTAFGSSGTAALAGFDALTPVVQPDGGIVVSGTEENGGTPAVARLHADGTPDDAFGASGETSWTGGAPTGLVLEPRGPIDVLTSDWTVQRVFADGRLGAQGGGPPDFVDPTADCNVLTGAALAVQPDDKPVAVGVACPDAEFAGEGPYLVTMRYTTRLGADAGVPLTIKPARPTHAVRRGSEIRISALVALNGATHLTVGLRELSSANALPVPPVGPPILLLAGSTVGKRRTTSAHITLATDVVGGRVAVSLRAEPRDFVRGGKYGIVLAGTDGQGGVSNWFSLPFASP